MLRTTATRTQRAEGPYVCAQEADGSDCSPILVGSSVRSRQESGVYSIVCMCAVYYMCSMCGRCGLCRGGGERGNEKNK